MVAFGAAHATGSAPPVSRVADAIAARRLAAALDPGASANLEAGDTGRPGPARLGRATPCGQVIRAAPRQPLSRFGLSGRSGGLAEFARATVLVRVVGDTVDPTEPAGRVEHAHRVCFGGPVDPDVEQHPLQQRRRCFLCTDTCGLLTVAATTPMERPIRAVTDLRSSARPPVAGSTAPEEPGAAVSSWPSNGDHRRPSPGSRRVPYTNTQPVPTTGSVDK